MPDLSWRDAIDSVLREAEEPMHYSEIAEAVSEGGLREDVGATPANTVNSIITSSLNSEGDDSPFVRVSRGYYSLQESVSESENHDLESDPENTVDTGLVNAFGMYWQRDYVLWKVSPKLLGQQQPGSQPVDFSIQNGVYLLHDGRQIVYVGRSTESTLGSRLRHHTIDRLNGRWDRFSWFGVFPVREDGSLDMTESNGFGMDGLVATMEALLIEALEPPQNRRRGDDFRAVEFLQVEDPEIHKSQIVSMIDELKKKL